MNDVVDVPLPVKWRVHDDPIIEARHIRPERQKVSADHPTVDPLCFELVRQVWLHLYTVDHIV